ncbi:hypothetical protein [Ralstonia phage RP31]|nr:hypothetical protein [Ralstonia phage RP31]
MLHGVGRADSDAELRANLRVILAILLVDWYESNPDLGGVKSHIFDVVTAPQFYEEGYTKTVGNNDDRLWFCSYIGFEKLTSQWAKENAKGCHGVICARIFNQDARQNEMDHHCIQVYF